MVIGDRGHDSAVGEECEQFACALEVGTDEHVGLDETFTASFCGLLELIGDDQAQFYYDVGHAGFSDVTVTGTLSCKHDEVTTIWARASKLAAPNAVLRHAEEDRDFKTRTVVFALGVGWSL